MSGELVKVLSEEGRAALEAGRPVHTMDVKNKAHRQMLAAGYQGTVPSIVDALNLEIAVEHLLIHRIRVADQQTGELKGLTRCVVFCKDGKAYSFCGEKARKDLLMPAELFGFPLPYSPPQRFKVTKTKTGPDGRGYINLEWMG